MRAYHRVDPLMDERKGHYTPAQFGAFLKVQLVAGRQSRRGRFRSLDALRAVLPAAYVKHVQFLIDEGDVVIAKDGAAYVDGWDEWQEGDLTVRDRMARLRNRKRNPAVTGDGKRPSPTATRSSVGVGSSVEKLTETVEVNEARPPDPVQPKNDGPRCETCGHRKVALGDGRFVCTTPHRPVVVA